MSNAWRGTELELFVSELQHVLRRFQPGQRMTPEDIDAAVGYALAGTKMRLDADELERRRLLTTHSEKGSMHD